jgi:SPP1 family predicted phage head-tail adaptor
MSRARDKRIRIEAAATVQDANGEMVPGWVFFAVMWANVFDISGKEYVAAGATQNPVQTKMDIAYKAGIVPNMRVLLGADIYNIEAALGQDHVDLLLMCSRGVNNG